ncbi:hypothetical protein LPW36_02150 [Jinshanibacter sp. LJY008]|uniref:Uncharacterized protein n=1 Tax=Limnobaculum eriocheiris TaxID=2897391 RepID=A0A9X1MU97_9GAMM|nr:hypothetical protein [Limnobaculum eriocheiris]MCD1124847.1 hypothetical protein [Limnobaculum eriocheiris]
MSHFTVLVVGQNPEQQLAPYHEFECTGINDQYVQDIDVTDEYRLDYERQEDRSETFLEFAKNNNDYSVVEFGQAPDIDDAHKYGWIQLDEDGEVAKVVRRTNPNAKWDWFVLGGRWRDFFKLKNGGFADSAMKIDIDFDGMTSQAAEDAKTEYQAFADAIAGMEFPKTWPEMMLGNTGSIDELRKAYASQPAVEAVRQAVRDKKLPFTFQCSFDYYGRNIDEYVKKCQAQCLTTYAVTMDGQWYARGEMGWFGLSSNEMTETEWNQKVAEMIAALPDDTVLSVYDCHI